MTEEQIPTLKLSFKLGEEINFTLPDLKGKKISLSEYKGKVVLVFFFTTWCPYCSAEAPYLEKEVWQKFKDQGIQVLAIDVLESKALAEKMQKRFKWTFPVLLDKDGKVTKKFAPVKEGLSPEVAIINSHFILDKESRLRFYEYLNMERFDARARATIKKLNEILAE
ncbi:TlpA family protein disulfide reductase [Candidatus Daviesbacteria bacterium]|nr:TlpA family protein disulfide reductase [Candidatus Daviesbacteria bacterium]